jgi:hypothetical protein
MQSRGFEEDVEQIDQAEGRRYWFGVLPRPDVSEGFQSLQYGLLIGALHEKL